MASDKRNQDKGKRDKQTRILARVGELIAGDGEPQADRDEKATTMLKEDHDRVRDLFKRYDDLGERAHVEKGRIAAEVSRELDVHAQLEEKIFYPACMKGEKDAEKIVRESFEEHKIVKTLLAEIDRLSPSDEQFDAKMTVLKENVEHHAKEEEDDLFPEAEDLLGDDQLRRLGGEMKDLKEEIEARGKSSGPGKTKRAAPAHPRTKSARSRRSTQHGHA